MHQKEVTSIYHQVTWLTLHSRLLISCCSLLISVVQWLSASTQTPVCNVDIEMCKIMAMQFMTAIQFIGNTLVGSTAKQMAWQTFTRSLLAQIGQIYLLFLFIRSPTLSHNGRQCFIFSVSANCFPSNCKYLINNLLCAKIKTGSQSGTQPWPLAMLQFHS